MCWGYGSELGVLRRKVGRGCGTENEDWKQNFISFADCGTTC